MAQLRTLGLAGGARGVEDHRGVLGRPLGDALERLGAGQLACSNSPGVVTITSVPVTLGGLRRLLGEQREDHGHLGAGIAPR